MKHLTVVLAFVMATSSVFAMNPKLESCLAKKETPSEDKATPDRPYEPPRMRGITEVLEQVARQKIEEKITEEALTSMLEKAGVEGAADWAGDLMRVYALVKNVEAMGNAKTDVQKYEAVYSTASTVVGFWFPIISLAMQLGLMQDRLIGNWSVADDYRYIEELRLRTLQIRNEMIEAKKTEMKANARALQVLQCETRFSQERTQRLVAIYQAAHCESATAAFSGQRTRQQTSFCLITGHSILREAKLSFSLQSRIWSDPMTLFLVKNLPEEKDRDLLKTAIREHFAKEVEFAQSVRESQKTLGEFREALLIQDEKLTSQVEIQRQKNVCRQMVVEKTKTLGEGFKQKAQDPEMWSLVAGEFRRFLDVDCPEIKTEKLSLLGLKMVAE